MGAEKRAAEAEENSHCDKVKTHMVLLVQINWCLYISGSLKILGFHIWDEK